MKFLQRLINTKELMNNGFNSKDKNGNYNAVWNEEFEAETPKVARIKARRKYPNCELGFTKKVK